MHTEFQLILASEFVEKHDLLTKQVADKLIISPTRIASRFKIPQAVFV
jgi:hypothetical protein